MQSVELSQLFRRTLDEIADLRLQKDGIAHYNSTYRYGLSEKQRYLTTLKFVKSANSSVSNKAKILDIGCAIGLMSLMFRRIGLEVSAVDKTDPPCDGENYGILLKEIFSRNNIIFKKCNVLYDSLPFPDESFDFVYMGAVFEHLLFGHKKVIGEIKRVLKGDGYLIIDTPNAAFLVNRIKLLLGKPILPPVELFYNSNNYEGHFREFTLEEMKSILNYSGLRVIRAKMLNFAFRPVLKYERLNWKRRSLITIVFSVSMAVSSFIPRARPCIWIAGQKAGQGDNSNL